MNALRTLTPLQIASYSTLYCAASASAFLFFNDDSLPSTPTTPCGCTTHQSQHAVASFNDIAFDYDMKVYFEELALGLPLLRRHLLSNARGNTVEFACGTGGNLRYYSFGDEPNSVRSVIMTDSSENMLKSTACKINDSSHLNSREDKSRIRLISTNVVKILENPSIFPVAKFDTVVDTFGVCSYDDPKLALQTMVKVCAPEGQLLLLEHGKSTYFVQIVMEKVNTMLQNGLERHIAGWGGCVWNRDIEALLEEGGVNHENGFDVSISKWHFGTTYKIVAKRRRL